jgi:hypothetical protein
MNQPDQPMSQPNAVRFKISHIFIVTAWVAIMVTLCRVGESFDLNGFGVAGTFTALSIVWLNAFGWLKWIQSRKWHVGLIGLSCGLFIVSLFLPAWAFFGGDYPGWKAATLAYQIAFDGDSGLDMRILFGCIGLANAMFLVVPLVGWLDDARPNLGKFFILLIGLLGAPVFFVVQTTTNSQLIGSYVWMSSYLVLLIAFPMRRVDAMVFTTVLSFWTTYDFVLW